MAVFNEKEMNRKTEKRYETESSSPPQKEKKQEKKTGEVVKIKGFQEKKETKPTVPPIEEVVPPKKKEKKNLTKLLGDLKKEKLPSITKIGEDKGRQGKTEKKKKKEKPPKIKKSIADIIPIIDITETGIFEFRDEQGFVDILQLQGTDIYSMNEEEAELSIYQLAHYFQSYSESIKMISMNFPVSTEQQQRYLLKKIETCKNPLYERFLVQKLKELQYLEWGRTNREYFLFIYGESEFVVKDRVETAKRYLQRCLPVLSIEVEKKIEILYKLHNQNSKIGTKK